jgi:hypothetical protein
VGGLDGVGVTEDIKVDKEPEEGLVSVVCVVLNVFLTSGSSVIVTEVQVNGVTLEEVNVGLSIDVKVMDAVVEVSTAVGGDAVPSELLLSVGVVCSDVTELVTSGIVRVVDGPVVDSGLLGLTLV